MKAVRNLVEELRGIRLGVEGVWRICRRSKEKVRRNVRRGIVLLEIARYSIEMRAVRNFVRRIARYSIELGVVRILLGEWRGNR